MKMREKKKQAEGNGKWQLKKKENSLEKKYFDNARNAKLLGKKTDRHMIHHQELPIFYQNVKGIGVPKDLYSFWIMLPTIYVLEINNRSNQPEHHIENDKRRKKQHNKWTPRMDDFEWVQYQRIK